jgi:hypothetical protein
MIRKSSIYRNVFLLSIVLLTMGYLAMGYDSIDVTSDERISPLYEVRMTQFADGMSLSPNGTSINSHEYGSIDTRKLTVLSRAKCYGNSCPLENSLAAQTISENASANAFTQFKVGTGQFAEAMGIYASKTPEKDYSFSNIASERLAVQTQVNHNEKDIHVMAIGATSWNTCQSTCGPKATCWNTCAATCAATCGFKPTCWTTCANTCGTKATCADTCKSTCLVTCEGKATCWNTCAATCGTRSTCWTTCMSTCANTCAINPAVCCPHNLIEEIDSK